MYNYNKSRYQSIHLGNYKCSIRAIGVIPIAVMLVSPAKKGRFFLSLVRFTLYYISSSFANASDRT